MAKKRWSDLLTLHRRHRSAIWNDSVRVAGGGAGGHLPAAEIRGNKKVWIAALINFIGPISYFQFGRKR